MEDKAMRGVLWTVLSYAGDRIILLLTTVVLARLLVPAEFGVFALATLTLGGLTIFSDVGLGSVFMIRQDLDERAKGTILTILMALSASAALVIVALAGVMADFFDEPQLGPVLRVLGLTQLYGGVNWFYDVLLQRELEFRRRFWARLARSVVSTVTSLVLAALGAGVWSLVAGLVVGDAIFTGLLLALAPYRVRPAYTQAAARDLIRGGRGFMVQSAVSFLKYNADYAAVGRTLGSAQVGFYTMAYKLGEQTYWAIADPIAQVTFPAFARMRERGLDVAPSFVSALRVVALVACPLGVLMSGAAEPFTAAIFGQRWEPMAGALSVLGIWAAVRPLQATIEWLLNSLGRAGPLATISTVLFVLQVPLLFVAADRGGIVAVSWVMLAHAFVSLIVLMAFAAREGHVTLAAHVSAIRAAVPAAAAAWVASRVTAEAAGGLPSGLTLVLALLAGVGVYLAVALLIEPRFPRDVVGHLRRALGRTEPTETVDG